MTAPQDNLYIIRYSLPPEPEAARPERLRRLLEFCAQGAIDEVMFFLMPEEYNRGQYDPADYRPWLDFAVQARSLVEQTGCATSLNPWLTLLHCSRGRRSRQLHYRRMVSDTGVPSPSVACPLCPQWWDIFRRTYIDFARAGFQTIWIEDDFRFHNHDAGWGGCFCDEHLRTLRTLGITARDRTELIRNLNAPGSVHPGRLIWMNLNRDTYIDLARRLRQAMDEIDPAIKLGLMCSGIPTHALEGRAWPDLLQALGGPDRAPVRPSGAAYREACRADFVMPAANLSSTIDVLLPGTKAFFEIENAPMSRFAKSNQLTAAQMAFALDGQCQGLTLDVLSFLGGGSDTEPLMAPTLAQQRTKLLRLRQLVTNSEPVAIKALIPTETARRAPGTGPADPRALPTANHDWFCYLQPFGYPCTNIADTTRLQFDGPGTYALSGPAPWGLSDDQLHQLLSSATVLLDPAAAHVIKQRGLAQLIGLNHITWRRHTDHPFSIEQALDTQPADVPQRSGLNFVDDDWSLATFDLTAAGQPQTEILDCYLNSLGVGTYLYQNPAGGRGLVLPTSLPLPDTLFDWTRKRWLDRFLHQLHGPAQTPYLIDAAWIYLSARTTARHKTIFLINTTFETCPRLTIQLPPDWAQLDWSLALHGRDLPATITVDPDHTLTFQGEFVGADWMLLIGS